MSNDAKAYKELNGEQEIACDSQSGIEVADLQALMANAQVDKGSDAEHS